jgi:hypothetical protein
MSPALSWQLATADRLSVWLITISCAPLPTVALQHFARHKSLECDLFDPVLNDAENPRWWHFNLNLKREFMQKTCHLQKP